MASGPQVDLLLSPCHFPHSPKSMPASQAAAWSSSCLSRAVSFLRDGHRSGRSAARAAPRVGASPPPRSVGCSLSSSRSPSGLFLPSESLYVSLHFWLCLSVCDSLCLWVSFSLSSYLTISLGLNSALRDSQEVMQGSWIPSLAAPASASPGPHPPHICTHLGDRSCAWKSALWAG